MYEIHESEQRVGSHRIPTFRREIRSKGNCLLVEAGTSAALRRDRQKEDPITFLSLVSPGDSFTFRCVPDGRGFASGFEVCIDGEDGMKALVAALEFAERAINDLRFERRD